jgi:hypothetical protein
MRTKFISLIILISFFDLSAQQRSFYYSNAVYREDIKTVMLFREGNPLSLPLIELGEETPLILKFDDLSGTVKSYYYTIIHCDADWNESYIRQNEYLEGFPDNPVNDYSNSFNTTFRYINYLLPIPNDKVKLRYSGNYVVVVYEGRRDNVVLTKRFYVAEQKVKIEGTVRRATLDAFKGSNQEVDFNVLHPTFRIENPLQEVKVVITQNGRWDNAIRNLKPLFVQNGNLVYDYNKENVFPAGNEFRYFDIRTIKQIREGVEKTSFFRPYFHVDLLPGEVRNGKKFFSYKEMNGNYVVESQDRVNDYDTGCDYFFTHFSLAMDAPLLGGTVNVFGSLTDWNTNKGNEMTWNFETHRYELTLLLKQGYYNYIVVYVPDGSKTTDHTNLEGSFWETENDYQIYVYYRETGTRYDRLIGYRQLNSLIYK